MTTNFTSRQKWTLWITFLIFLLAFGIFVLVPKIFASEGDIVNRNTGYSVNVIPCTTSPGSTCAQFASGVSGYIDYFRIYIREIRSAGTHLWSIDDVASSTTGICTTSVSTASYTALNFYEIDFSSCENQLEASRTYTLSTNDNSLIYLGAYPPDYYFYEVGTSGSGPGPQPSSLTITAPTSGSTASSTFPLNFTYNLQGENSNKLLVIFEAWSASSTCPVYGDSEWQTEYDAGWFYNQSLPYFSPRLTATSTEATSTISVYNLDQPFYYNCVHCYFYNEDTATSTFEEKCPDYFLNVSGYIPPSQPLPIGSWPSYYASHTDDKFPTSTQIFTTITGVFSDIVQKITSFVNDFRTIFDSESANAKGAQYGSAIPTARGYLKPINDFFGSLPVSEIFIFCILTLLVVNVYRLVKTILQLIRG